MMPLVLAVYFTHSIITIILQSAITKLVVNRNCLPYTYLDDFNLLFKHFSSY